MVPDTALRFGSGASALLRYAVFVGALVATIIAGLLAMHTLNLHGTPVAHAGVSVVVIESGHADHGAAQSGVEGTSPSREAAHGATRSLADDVGGGHLGLAMACVLVLLLLVLLFAPRRPLLGSARTSFPLTPIVGSFGGVLSRAPSLHVLCVSRT